TPTAIDADLHRSIVIAGVPEYRSPNSVERANYDYQSTCSVLSFLDIEYLPSAVYRMGIPNPNRPRLLKVVLPTSRFQRQAVQRAPRLRSFSHRGVHLRPSLTKEERERRRRERLGNPSSPHDVNASKSPVSFAVNCASDQSAVANINYVRCDRAYKRGGGVLILLKQSITYNLVFKESAKDAYEILVIDAFLEPSSVRFILVYRTPSCSAYATSLLIKAISDFTSYNGHTVVLGDFNMPDLNWKNDYPTNTPSSEMITLTHLKQFVQNPTRGDSCLDLLFCNSDSLVKKVVVMPPVGSSDHASIEFHKRF
ncbi:hypothetical protein OSTOST_03953, partial [Ostertagia ostertagi]